MILRDLLAPSVVTGIISRIQAPGDVLQRHFGLNIGGSRVEQVSGRQYSYDILDYTRAVATGRRPATGPAVIAPVPVAKQNVTIPRAYEKLPLSYEMLHNIRQLGANAGQRDTMGTKYVERQFTEAKRRHNNWREIAVAALLRQGTLSFRYDAPDDLTPVYTLGGSPGETIDWLIPAAHKTKLNMTGDGDIIGTTWSNAAAPIPQDIFQINAAFQQATGSMLQHAYMNSVIWNYVITNTDVRNLAGSSNKPFAEFKLTGDSNPDGVKTGLFSARFDWCPWVEWHVYDGGLEVDGTYSKFLPDTLATFSIEHGPWLKGIEGSEPRKTNPMSPAEEVFGLDSWIREWDEPARLELHCLQNFMIELNTPKSLAIGTVVF